MKKKKICARVLAGTLALVFLLQCAVLCSCAKKESGSETAETQKIEREPFVMPDGEVLKYWLQWYTTGENSEQLKRPDGTSPSWDWIGANNRGINLMHIIFYPEDEEGNPIYDMPNTDSLKTHCDKMQYEIEQTHEAGIKVIAYSTDVQFFKSESDKMGYSIEALAAVKNGEPVIDYNWTESGTYIACINSPEWRDWCRANVKVLAEAGFDGLQYDYGPYSASGYFCECENCKKGWSEYSTEKFGEAKDYPGSLDYNDEVAREYMRWKTECMCDFFVDTLSEAKKVNPDFDFIMNNSVMAASYGYECLYGCYDMTSSEYWGLEAGYDSSLFMYQLNEALGFSELLGIFNSDSQVTPRWRYKVALCEACAVNGGASFGYGDFADTLLEFIDMYPELYLENESRADTAILYSTEGAMFSYSGDDYAREVATELTKGGVLYDYIVVEKDDALDKLDDYDVFVIPSYDYFDDSWKPVIEKLMKSGKEVVSVGAKTKKYLADYTEGATAKINYRANSEYLRYVMKTTSAYDIFKCENNMNDIGTLEFTVRHLSWKYDFVNIIRLGDCEDYLSADADLTASFEYRIPEGSEIESITAYCPYLTDIETREVPVDWTVENGILKLTTGEFDTYSVVKITYKD